MPYDFQTSLPAYHENRQRKDKCKAKVLEAIKKLEPCTDRQLSNYTGLPINVLVARRFELVNQDAVVVLSKKDRCPETNRTVNFWEVKKDNYQPKMF